MQENTPQNDNTGLFIIVPSFLIFVLFAYLGYNASGAYQTQLEETESQEEDLRNARNLYHESLIDLLDVSRMIGWSQNMRIDLHQLDWSQAPSYLQNARPDRIVEEIQGEFDQAPTPEMINEETRRNLEVVVSNSLEGQGFPEEDVQRATENLETTIRYLYGSQGFQRPSRRALTARSGLATALNSRRDLVATLGGELIDITEPGGEWELEEEFGLFGRDIDSDSTGITLETLLVDMSSSVSDLRSQNEELQETLAARRGNLREYTGGDDVDVGNLEQLREEREPQLAEIESDIEERRSEVLRLQRQTADRTRERNRLREQLTNQLTDVRSSFQTRVRNLRQEVQQLRDRRDALERARAQDPERADEVDGEVLVTNQNSGSVFIDIGHNHGLLEDTEFRVFGLRKGGQRISKGRIQVREVFQDHARASILQQEDAINKPIQQGDLVESEDYNRGQRLQFAFAGNMIEGKNRDILREQIEQKGHRVQNNVNLETTYLVIGENHEGDANYEQAQELGIPIINQKQLQRMLNIQ